MQATQVSVAAARYADFIEMTARLLWHGQRRGQLDYLRRLRNRSHVTITWQHLACLAAAIALVAEMWIVVSALADRGADVCAMRSIDQAQGSRTIKKPCAPAPPAPELLLSQRPVVYLSGNCQTAPNDAMMAHRDRTATAAAAQATRSPLVES